MTMSGDFGQFSFFFREKPTNRHRKVNPLNLEEDLEEDLLSRFRKTSSLEEILTVRSKYGDSIFFVCGTNNFKNL